MRRGVEVVMEDAFKNDRYLNQRTEAPPNLMCSLNVILRYKNHGGIFKQRRLSPRA